MLYFIFGVTLYRSNSNFIIIQNLFLPILPSDALVKDIYDSNLEKYMQ